MNQQHFDNYLLYQLAMVSNALSSEFHNELSKHDIGPAAWRILYCLWSTPDMRLTELARHVLYKQPRVTKRVAQLQEAGLVEKTVRDDDRRNVSLRLTQKGKKLVFPFIKKSIAHEAKIMSVLPQADRQKFRQSLLALIESLGQ
ncbi:MAG: MarR family transcriptional regulator [Robiginitomaculum sp.]